MSSGSATAANPISRLGHETLRLTELLGRIAAFGAAVAAAGWRRPWRLRRVLDEIYGVGVLSLTLIGVSAVAVGAVLGLQTYTALVRFGAEDTMGTLIGLSLVRELGPVLTALLVTGRAASAMTAEIGAMVRTEQLDGLRMMSIDPLEFVVAPKALAMVVCMPLLSALFIVLGLAGGYLVGVVLLGVDAGTYLSSLESAILFREDVLGSFMKSFFFGGLVALVATWRGYTAEPSAVGVSRATTSTVVWASVTTLLLNYAITALWGFLVA